MGCCFGVPPEIAGACPPPPKHCRCLFLPLWQRITTSQSTLKPHFLFRGSVPNLSIALIFCLYWSWQVVQNVVHVTIAGCKPEPGTPGVLRMVWQ